MALGVEPIRNVEVREWPVYEGLYGHGPDMSKGRATGVSAPLPWIYAK